MTADDHNGDAPPGGKSDKPRRRPPVIELEATEVGADGQPQAQKPKPKPEPEQKPEAAARSAEPSAERQKGISLNPGIMTPALIAGGIGALIGAGIAFFGFQYFDRPDGSRAAELAREVAALSARIETLSARPAANPDAAALGQRLDQLAAAIAETEKKLSTTEKLPSVPQAATPMPATEASSKELHDALADLKRLAEQNQQPAISSALESLSARIAELDNRISSLAAASRSSAGSELAKEILALNTLAAAINSGKPFSQELGAARAAIGQKTAPLEFLNQSAAKGIPAVAVLAKQFSQLAPKLLHGTETGNGFLAKLYSNAARLVEVRKIGEPQGDNAAAVVARMEAQLARGDLAGALAESVKLPEPAKVMAASWLAEAGNRLAAELAVKKLIDSTLSSPEPSRS